MKKKILTLLLASLMATTSFVGCAGEKKEENILKVGMECAYAPFNWTQEEIEVPNGEKAQPIFGTDDYAYGYDVMMAEKLAENLGYDGIEIHRSEWDSIGMGLDVGDYDCIIAGMGYTEKREKVYDFTVPYYHRLTVVTARKDSPYASFTDLAQFEGTGAKVTTQIGTAWVDLVPQIVGAEPIANYSTTAECFLAVDNKAADITVIDLPTTVSALLTNENLVKLELTEEGGFEDNSTNVCIAVREGDTELQEKLNKALEALEWDKEKMDAMMAEAIELQPANN